MKSVFIIFIFLYSVSFSQSNSFDENEPVLGFVVSNSGIYLILEQGLTKISENDIYAEYYRNIYNDSTLTNPNMIIENNYYPNLIPFIHSGENSNEYRFDESLLLNNFIEFSGKNNYNIRSDGMNLIRKYLNN